MSIKIIHRDEPRWLKMFKTCPVGTVFDSPNLYRVGDDVELFVKIDNTKALSLSNGRIEYFDSEEAICDRNIEVIIH